MKLTEKVKVAIMAGVLAVAGVGTALMPAQEVAAERASNLIMSGAGENGTGLVGEDTQDPKALVQGLIRWFLWIVGILSVVIIIYGGVLYTTSAGDQQKVTKAKNTILYGLIGLAISVLAYAIVSFVVNTIINNATMEG